MKLLISKTHNSTEMTKNIVKSTQKKMDRLNIHTQNSLFKKPNVPKEKPQ